MIYTLQSPAKHLIKNDITLIMKLEVVYSNASSNEDSVARHAHIHTDTWKLYV